MKDATFSSARLLALYERISDAEDAIPRLRRFVLDLAVRGKLVEQDANDEAVLLGKLKAVIEPVRKVPSNWRALMLGHALDFQYGKGKKASERLDDGPVPVFGSNGIVGYSDEYLTEKTSIIIGRKGSAGALHLCEGPSWTTDVAYYVLAPEFFAIRFLLLTLQSLELDKLGKGVKPGLSRADAYALEIHVSPLAEQHRIVAKVDELMALCDQLEQARAGREAVRDRLTSASLARLTVPETDEESFQSHAHFALQSFPTLTTRPDQIKTLRQTILNLAVRGKLGGGSTGKYESLGTFRSLQNGYAFKSEWFAKGGVRLLRNANVGHGALGWTDVVYLPEEQANEYERFKLREDDIVLTLDRPFIVTGTKVARVKPTDLPALLLQRVGRFVETTPGLSDEYLFRWINSPHFNEQIDPGRSNGVPHISSKQVEAAEIFVPPLAEQHRIVAKVDALMALCDQLEASLTTTATTRSKLLGALLHEALEHAADELEAAE